MRRELKCWDVVCDKCGKTAIKAGYEFELLEGWSEEQREEDRGGGCYETYHFDYCPVCSLPTPKVEAPNKYHKADSVATRTAGYEALGKELAACQDAYVAAKVEEFQLRYDEKNRGSWSESRVQEVEKELNEIKANDFDLISMKDGTQYWKTVYKATCAFQAGGGAAVCEGHLLKDRLGMSQGEYGFSAGVGADIEEGDMVLMEYGIAGRMFPVELGGDGKYRRKGKHKYATTITGGVASGPEMVFGYISKESLEKELNAAIWSDLTQLDAPTPEEAVKTRACGKCGKECPENELVDTCNAYKRFLACKECAE